MSWKEFRLWSSQIPEADKLFAFKKNVLVPLLDSLGFNYAFILDEFSDDSKFVLVRLEVDSEAEARIKEAFERAIQGSSLFSRLEVVDWSPEEDARKRIQRALAQLQTIGAPANLSGKGWWVVGDFPTQTVVGSLQMGEMPIDEKVDEDVIFMTKVVGAFTLAYLRAMPRRVDDRWLKTLFVHLLLNSISTPQNEEKQIRGFPYV